LYPNYIEIVKTTVFVRELTLCLKISGYLGKAQQADTVHPIQMLLIRLPGYCC